jgi:hypothetical protein
MINSAHYHDVTWLVIHFAGAVGCDKEAMTLNSVRKFVLAERINDPGIKSGPLRLGRSSKQKLAYSEYSSSAISLNDACSRLKAWHTYSGVSNME